MHVTTEASLRNVRGQPSVKETGKQQRQGRADASLAVFKYVMAQALVTKAVQENAVMVFSKSYCPHCIRAKRILDTEIGKAKYSVMELESRPDGSAIQDYLSKLTGARTVPRVFIQGRITLALVTPTLWY